MHAHHRQRLVVAGFQHAHFDRAAVRVQLECVLRRLVRETHHVISAMFDVRAVMRFVSLRGDAERHRGDDDDQMFHSILLLRVIREGTPARRRARTRAARPTVR